MEHEDKVENTTSNVTGNDITNEIGTDNEDIDIFEIEELAPSSYPITIPYVEFYRTNELEYIPYMSPYNVGVSSSDSSSSSTTPTTDVNSNTANQQGTNQNGTTGTTGSSNTNGNSTSSGTSV